MQLRSAIFAAFGIGLACSTEPAVELGGEWAFNESFTSSTGVSCQATGDLLINQFDQGARISGQRSRTVTCDADPGLVLDGTHALTNGEVHGPDISFEIDFCEYEGTLNVSEMNGSFSCPDLGQPPINFSGTWTASR